MDDQLDNDLRDHIKEVFDNFEDTSADAGWLLLREKFPEKQSDRRAFAWIRWGAAAAILLAFLGIGLWIMNTPNQPIKLTVKPHGHTELPGNSVKEQHKDTVNNIAASQARKDTINNIAAGKPQKETANNIAAVASKNQSKIKTEQASVVALPNQAKAPADFLPQNKTFNNIASQNSNKPAPVLVSADSSRKKTFIVKTKVDTAKAVINKVPPTQMAVNNAPKNDVPKSVVIKDKPKDKSIMAMFNEDKNEKAPLKEIGPQGKRVSFGVYAATYFNYAKGSDNQVNMGAGVTTDIRINKNLKLVTGVAIAQNSLSYAGSPSLYATQQSRLVPAAATTMTFTALSTPTIKNYNASLVGLDIPVNLKYEFNPQKTDAYFSAGLSSGTFIDESYTYRYNYPSFNSQSLQKTRDETAGKSANGFYFAKTLNLAFGIGYPFGKNRVVLEPFLKYPLDGLGSQNLRFGAGGVNLKFNFLTAHK